ncbi:NADH-quinone oxidoreductase subunit C [Candidatus Saganbacteria bacterium]|nr:NADH-quinone oxidoreductase subunit C [Candidatus Saganbacteria bacterium]
MKEAMSADRQEKFISKEELVSFCEKIKDTYNYLLFVTAVDYPEKNQLQMVYYIQSFENKDVLILKIDISREKPEIASVVPFWPAADWHEREAYDMFGINFIGHPDLRRILLPPEWVGAPLLKDYVKASVVKKPETVK